MKDLGTALICEKNALFTAHPWIFLFAVEIDAATTWRFAAYPKDITWNGYTWSAMSAAVELITQDSSGRLADINVHVENVSLQVSAYQENNDLRGKDVDIYIVNYGHLDETNVITFSYRVNEIQRSDTSAIFQLGHEDLFLLEIPHIRNIRDRCPYRFRDTRCRYPDDWFGKSTEQDLRFGGDGDKGGGWATLNMANTTTADINRTNAGKLTVITASGGPYKFLSSIRTAPQVYKTFKGAFDFYARMVDPPTSFASTGFCVQSTDDAGDSVGIMSIERNGVDYFYARNTANGITVDTNVGLWRRNVRIVRAGATIALYARTDAEAAAGTDWSSLWSVTRIDIPHTVYVGFVFPTPTSSVGTAMTWDYFKANSGGIGTCDYSFDGPNGCRVHQNQPRFGGAAGLPYGKLSL